MALPDVVEGWRRRALLLRGVSALVTGLLAGALALPYPLLSGMPPRFVVAAAGAGFLAGVVVGWWRGSDDPLAWLERRSPSTAEEVRTAVEVYGSEGLVAQRLVREAYRDASSLSFSDLSPPLPVKRGMALLLVALLFVGYTQAPADLKEGVRGGVEGLPSGPGGGGDDGGDGGGAVSGGNGQGGGGSSTATAKPGGEGEGSSGGEGGEMQTGEATDVQVGGEEVPVKLHPSYGSERSTSAEASGGFVESEDYPARAESSGSFADSLSERHREAVIRYFSSMVG